MAVALALAPKASTRLFLDVERSVCGKAWRDRLDERATARALAIAQRHNVPELLARILSGRGVEVDEVEAFLDPTVRRLMPDPHTVTAMEQAAQRLADAMLRGEQIAIFGDYDVDGATASALLARFMRIGGSEPIVHIPDRIFEGYGPNVEAIRALAGRGATLLVTVDCGTTSIEPLAEARRLGMDVIVLDHHQADERLPDAIVVTPYRLDDLSGLGHLAAVGIVFLTVVAVNRVLRARGFWTQARPEPDLLGWLDIVALGTVADVVPLKGLNRAFVAKGLLALRRRDSAGLTALMDVARLTGPPEPFHLGFLLGPRRGHALGQFVFEISAEFGKRAVLDRDAGRHGMTAALEQQALGDGAPHGLAEINAQNGAARAGAGAARLERNGKGRTIEPLLQPSREQTNDTRVPAGRRGHHHRALLFDAERGLGLRLRLLQHRDFHGPPLAVQAVKLRGNAARFDRIVGAKKQRA